MDNSINISPTIFSKVKKYFLDEFEEVNDQLAVEIPVLIKFNHRKYVVMMASPSDYEEFGIGFTLSEGLIKNVGDIKSINHYKVDNGVCIDINVSRECLRNIFENYRNLDGRTSCGICGINEIDKALRKLDPIKESLFKLKLEFIFSALNSLPNMQIINRETGSVHAAAFFDNSGKLISTKEDVGRHNALDKLIGYLAKNKLNPYNGFIIITSRCSMEMVQKTITIGCPVLVSVSAPTSLAIDIANQNNLTVLSFARKEKINIYSNSHRIV